MTPTETRTTPTDPGTADGADGADDEGSQAGGSHFAPDRPNPALRVLTGVGLVAAVLIPLAMFVVRALHAPVNFDGGMNLQVAQNLADGDGYMRFYDQPLPFPHEVQTNGPYMYLAAAAIKVLGPTQLALQLSNLIFIAGLLVCISLMLARENIVVRIVGPALALLAVPSVAIFGLGGLGEVPVTCFLFAMILALVQAVRSPERAPWWVLGAAVAFGAAFNTKTFSVGAIATLVIGVVCVLVAAPDRRSRVLVVLACLGAALLPVAREIHRVVSLGSIEAYQDWWSDQSGMVTTQSGLESTSGRSPLQTFLDHMHVLSGLVDHPAELLLVVLFAPLLWVGGLLVWRWRRDGLRATLSDPYVVLVLTVAVLAASYVLWWMLLLPDNKLWIRRIIPGVLAVHVLHLFLASSLIRAAGAALQRRRDQGVSLPVKAGVAVALAAVTALVILVPGNYLRLKADGSRRALAEGQEQWLDANEAAASYVEDNDGLRWYGDEWWSAPVVSVMSDTGFYNLGDADFCSLDPARDRLVWDYDAKTIRSQDPWTRDGKLVFEEAASFGWFVTIYRVGPAPGLCD